jgi:Spy/CpxP family protein refolding chaperone
MKIKLLVGALVFLIVVNLVTIGSFFYFQWQKPPRDDRPFGPPPAMMDLRPEQHQQLREKMQQFMTKTRPQKEKISQLTEEILQLLQSDPVDKDAINSKMQEISQLRLELSYKAIDQFIEMKTFLSPEQQKHFFRQLMETRPMPGRGPGMEDPSQRGDRRLPFERPPREEEN